MRQTFKFVASLGAFCAAAVLPATGQTLGGCNVFPANNIWNVPINTLPVDPNSTAYINTMGASTALHPDFSSSGGGIPYTVVPASQPEVSVSFSSPSQSDPGPYPVPSNAAIESGSDHHVLVLDQGNCKLYELFSASVNSNGTWTASSGAVFDLNSNILRPNGWTSSDAAGLPVLPGLVRYDEVMSGKISHALRMTAPQTRNTYIWPARHEASSLSGSQYPPLGERFRLKASFVISSSLPTEVQVILTALKTYGAILADNGSSWYISGATDSRWNDSNLHALSEIIGSNMEAVNESSLEVSPNSAAVTGGAVGLTGVYLDEREVSHGATVNAQAILTAAAPSGGATVSIASSNPSAVSAPSSVTVPAGSVSTSVPVTIGSISSTTPVVLSSSYNSATEPSPVLFVTGSSGTAPILSAFSTSAATTPGGTSITGTVSVTTAAPTGGTSVALKSQNSSVLSVPPTVTIPAGATSAPFTISALPQTANSTESITTTLNGESLSIAITVTAGSSKSAVLNSFTLSSTTVSGGSNVTGTVTLTGPAPSGGASVSLLSSNIAAASVPSTVVVPANSSSANFTVTTYKQTSNQVADITASFGGVSKSVNLTVTSNTVPPSSVSIFKSSAVPGTPSEPDGNAVELGVKFTSDVAGTVSGIRFYKGSSNTGTHTGHLWSASGTLLGSVTFENETATGWQQANFSTPVKIAANTVYVVSYYAPNGHYADDLNFFTSAANNAPLHALEAGADGANGVYVYGSSAFPTQGWYASNYWVDLVFVP